MKVSVRAGIRPLGFMARNQGSFWVFLEISILWTMYGILEMLGESGIGLEEECLPKFFQGDGDLDAIWSLGGVQVDVW